MLNISFIGGFMEILKNGKSAGPCLSGAHDCGNRDHSPALFLSFLLSHLLSCFAPVVVLFRTPDTHQIAVTLGGILTLRRSRRPSEKRCQNGVQKVIKKRSTHEKKCPTAYKGDSKINEESIPEAPRNHRVRKSFGPSFLTTVA